jgi:hypothetical protein
MPLQYGYGVKASPPPRITSDQGVSFVPNAFLRGLFLWCQMCEYRFGGRCTTVRTSFSLEDGFRDLLRPANPDWPTVEAPALSSTSKQLAPLSGRPASEGAA